MTKPNQHRKGHTMQLVPHPINCDCDNCSERAAADNLVSDPELNRSISRALMEQAARQVCDVWRDPLADATQLLAALAVLSVSLDVLDGRRGVSADD